MPATERTYYNIRRLHVVFAVSSVLLVLATVWMLARDHLRSWKPIQRKRDRIEARLAEWKRLQTQTEEVIGERRRLKKELSERLSRPFSHETLEAFREQVRADARRRGVTVPSFKELNEAVLQLKQAASKAEAARKEWYQRQLELDKTRVRNEEARGRSGDISNKGKDAVAVRSQVGEGNGEKVPRRVTRAEREMELAQVAVVPLRRRVLKELRSFLRKARFREDKWEGKRRTELAELEVKESRLGAGVRDQLNDRRLKRLRDDIERRKQKVRNMTLAREAATAHRQQLQSLMGKLTERAAAIRERIEEIEAETARWERRLAERKSDYFNFWGPVPLPGKKWLELPFLDVFNSPRNIETLWSEGLDRPAGSFGRVPRFDRCTTCHQRLKKPLSHPPDPSRPRPSGRIDFALSVPQTMEAEPSGEPRGDVDRPRSAFGLALADTGLMDPADVTIRLVEPGSPAAAARPWRQLENRMSAGDIRGQFFFADDVNWGTRRGEGLRSGDVIVAINETSVPRGRAGRSWVRHRLLNTAAKENGESKGTLRVTVRRGLPQPYGRHPRLHMFVGEESPHKASKFGCTVCHAGQGSATSFKWASHTPNNLEARRRWREQYDWFRNPDWKYPMRPKQFLESACLKCHHDVAELERNSEFDEAPAPKLARGYRLVRALGCFGCHEIRGYDHSHKRIGPDLRLEPNYHAAALQLKGVPESGYARLTDAERQSVDRLIQSPGDDTLRAAVYELLQTESGKIEDQPGQSGAARGGQRKRSGKKETNEPRVPPALLHRLLPLLEGRELPGTLRKVGPSLRFVRHKLGAEYMSEWIREPRRLRSSTRMPHAFGLWDHLPAARLRARRGNLRQELQRLKRGVATEKSRSVKQIRANLTAVNRELERVDQMEKRFEPVAIYAMVRYLLARSQPFDYLEPPSGIAPVLTAEDREAQLQRGKVAFQQLGCLACHDHDEFPDMQKYRDPEYVVQGPDLSDLADKLKNSSSSDGAKWLYSWLAQPTQYNPRTTMPRITAEPIEHRDADGHVTAVTDPLADMVAFLLQDPRGERQESGDSLKPLDEQDKQVLSELALTYLKDTFPEAKAQRYVRVGIPSSRNGQLRGAERELLTTPAEQESSTPEQMIQKRLFYVARESLLARGCCGCHDIPGMEDAQRIGPELSDWGREPTTELAFGHVDQYVRRTRGQRSDAGEKPEGASTAGRNPGSRDAGPAERGRVAVEARDQTPASQQAKPAENVWSPEQYLRQLELRSRIGFLYQKLWEPRSFDYVAARNKKYTERLRMPQFSLTAGEREAIMTFILGLVADPPRREYIYSPAPDKKGIFQGHEILTKYSCRGCHMERSETWELEFPPGEFGKQPRGTTYPFLQPAFELEERKKSTRVGPNGRRRAAVSGMPVLGSDGLPLILDDFEFPIEEEPNQVFDLNRLIYPFNLWQPALVDGHPYRVGEVPLNVFAQHLKRQRRSFGGALTKYLLPRLVEREKAEDPNATAAEAWAWLPPNLADEGGKVRPQWLHDYLLHPTVVRPAAVMRMPRYNMSAREAARLVDYFAAKDHVAYPFKEEPARRKEHLDKADRKYARKLQELADQGQLELAGLPRHRRLADAMNVITDHRYCVKCHRIGDYEPPGGNRGKAPDLATVHERLRGEYLRKWLAKPTSIQPYTSMPVNIPYNAEAALQGTTVPQELYHGNSTEQLDALVDLLMNFDRYSRQFAPITPMARGGNAGRAE